MLHNLVPDDQQEVQADIHHLLEEFESVFAEPSSLPLHRQLDHDIHLLPSSASVNVRPYRYPHFQKNEIEKQAIDMLNSGIIRPSTSPFLSHVLLVKKKDGS